MIGSTRLSLDRCGDCPTHLNFTRKCNILDVEVQKSGRKHFLTIRDEYPEKIWECRNLKMLRKL